MLLVSKYWLSSLSSFTLAQKSSHGMRLSLSDVLKIIAVPTDITPPTEEELAEQARIAELAREAVPEDGEEKKDDGASDGEDAGAESKGIIDKVLTACIC